MAPFWVWRGRQTVCPYGFGSLLLKDTLHEKWSHLLAAGMMALSFCSANTSDGKTLYFYNWTEYVPPGLLEQFTKETGIKVIYSTYESNESMYAKLKTYKDGAYDLVVPSTYFIAKMSKEGMLQKSTRASSATSRILILPC